MFAICGIATILFLGGWHLGVLPPGTDLTDYLGPVLGNIINVLVFIFKGWVLVFVMMWVRWTLPRLRIDQVMMTCLRYLLPISCVLLLGVSVWQMLAWEFTFLTYCNYLLFAGCVAFVLYTGWRLFTTSKVSPTELMPGSWGVIQSETHGVAARP